MVFVASPTVCRKGLDPFYIVVSYNIKWAKTSWTYSIIVVFMGKEEEVLPKLLVSLIH